MWLRRSSLTAPRIGPMSRRYPLSAAGNVPDTIGCYKGAMTLATTSPAPRIVVVDDDESVRDAVVDYLGRHGFEACGVEDGAGLDLRLGRGPADLVVLDLMLPGEDGLAICRRLNGSPPVLMLSALGETGDRIVGLELGAADYLAKPFDPRELVARVRAVLRRRPEVRADRAVYRFAGWTFDAAGLTLHAPDGHMVPMTGGELRLFRAFVANPNRLLARDHLLDLTHGEEAGPFDRAIDLAVSRLRRRLGGHGGGELIETVRGLGYRFRARVERA